jgi:HAAS domain-containing protein
MLMIEQSIQTRIDSYLMNLRRCLRELPSEDVNDILREIRSHILDRAEAAGELTDERIVEILRALGRPEDIGPLYEAEAQIARARASFSPSLILRTTMRWGMRSLFGFIVFMAGLFGYSMAAGFLVCAILKPFLPDEVGMWVHPNGFVTFGAVNVVHGTHELLGWWIIPVSIVASAVFLVGTTRTLRAMLRYARRSAMLPAMA